MTIVCPLPYPLFFFLTIEYPELYRHFFLTIGRPLFYPRFFYDYLTSLALSAFLWLFDVLSFIGHYFNDYWTSLALSASFIIIGRPLFYPRFLWLFDVPCSFCLLYVYLTSLVPSELFPYQYTSLTLSAIFFTLEVPSFIRLFNDRRTFLALYVILTCYRMSQALQPFF